jgi:hypothetical protein
MTLLPTSLLIFLAIKLTVMRKDPTEFRERFKRWKQGLPAYKDGKRYIKNDDDTWTRITDDQMAD